MIRYLLNKRSYPVFKKCKLKHNNITYSICFNWFFPADKWVSKPLVVVVVITDKQINIIAFSYLFLHPGIVEDIIGF